MPERKTAITTGNRYTVEIKRKAYAAPVSEIIRMPLRITSEAYYMKVLLSSFI